MKDAADRIKEKVELNRARKIFDYTVLNQIRSFFVSDYRARNDDRNFFAVWISLFFCKEIFDI